MGQLICMSRHVGAAIVTGMCTCACNRYPKQHVLCKHRTTLCAPQCAYPKKNGTGRSWGCAMLYPTVSRAAECTAWGPGLGSLSSFSRTAASARAAWPWTPTPFKAPFPAAVLFLGMFRRVVRTTKYFWYCALSIDSHEWTCLLAPVRSRESMRALCLAKWTAVCYQRHHLENLRDMFLTERCRNILALQERSPADLLPSTNTSEEIPP